MFQELFELTSLISHLLLLALPWHIQVLMSTIVEWNDTVDASISQIQWHIVLVHLLDRDLECYYYYCVIVYVLYVLYVGV